jgi:two-component system CheB/CheR fusion protein
LPDKLTVRQIRLRERERVGQELHDGLCQSLLALSFELKAMAQQAAAEESRSTPVLARAAELLSAAAKETHDVARGYLADEVEAEGGLLTALRTLVEKKSLKAPCKFRTSLAAWPLHKDKATQLYRIAQEALANAVRHSGARHIVVAVEPDGAFVRLRVEDDGKGLPPGALASGRLGLDIMKRRAALLGGALEITTQPGSGTMVSCSVPGSPEL